jgi:Ca-activated chloride channel family protein
VPTGLHRQPQRPTFRVKVDLVTVDVSVTRKNLPVSGMTARDFVVYDNGVKQELQPVAAEHVPLEAWLVLDTSDSVRPKLPQLVQAAWAFVDGLSTRDRAALIGFSQTVVVRQILTGDLDAMRHALRALESKGTTALYDATYVALRLREASNTRAVAVILTDGCDNTSWLTADRVVTLTERSDLLIYGVSLGPGLYNRYGDFGVESDREPRRTPQYEFLRKLAEASGGRVFNATWAQLKEAFARILTEIRARYVLTYYPTSATPGWHKLEVKLTGAKGEITARRGYWVAAAK